MCASAPFVTPPVAASRSVGRPGWDGPFRDPSLAVLRNWGMSDVSQTDRLARRSVILGGMAALIGDWRAAAAPPPTLSFSVSRNDRLIGEQQISFSRNDQELSAQIEADLAVKIGPIVAYRYHFEALERWRQDAFSQLDSMTNDNGRKMRVSARRADGRVRIETPSGAIEQPPTAIPLTHWNQRIASSALFNPQDGKRLAETVTLAPARPVELADGGRLQATAIVLRGDADIDDLYDPAGVWVGLVGRLKDGSRLVYKRR